MKHIYALFALLITSFISWGQTESIDCPLGSISNNQMVFTTENFTITHAKESDNNFASYSPWRVYTNNVVTFTGSENVQSITSIVITATSNSYANAAIGNNSILSVVSGEGTISGTVSGSTVTLAITGENVNSVSLKPSAQTRWSSITINYTLADSDCTDSTLAFGNTSATADLANTTTFTQSATSLNQTTAITYTSSDEDVATVNPTTGEVTLVSVGTTTITATQAAGEHNGESYCAATATYELEVITTEPVLTVSTNSLSFTGYEGGSFTTQDLTITGLNLTGDITLTLTGDTNFAINPTTLAATGGDVTITYTPSATPASHSATLTVANGAFSEVILLTANTLETPNECGFEDFSNSELTNTYDDGNFVGNNGITWTYGHSRNVDTFGIHGEGIMLRRASDSYLEATITGGVGTISFDYRRAFTGTNERQLELIVNGVSLAQTPTFGSDDTVFNFSHAINSTETITIRIKNIGETSTNRQTIIDNITWTCYSEEPTPALSVNFTQEDLHIEHNINATTPTVAEAIVNIANLTEEFNLSVVSTTEDFVVNTTGELVNGENTIQIQLADGLAAGEYTGSIIVSLGEETLATLPLTGEVVDIPLSTPENAIEGLRIYPNPATDVVFVTSNSGAMKNVQLFDLSGKKVLDVDTTSSFQVNALANGIYVMKVTEEGKTSTSKLIVK